MIPAPKRRWYQFSLRTLLVLMTLLCIGPGGYVAFEQRKALNQKAAVVAIQELGGQIEYDQRTRARSPAIRLILGDESFGNVNRVIFGLRKEADRPITDADLRYLRSFPRLATLWLSGRNEITDAGIVDLAGIPGLHQLILNNTGISDSGLVHIAELENLKILSVNNAKVTDAGLVYLFRLKKLEHLSIQGTQVTSAGEDEIHSALPDCIIFRAE